MMTRFTRYDRIAEHYPTMWPFLVPGYLPVLNAMLDIVRVCPTKPRDVLDLGCGPGSATIAVASGCDPKGKVTLVDGSTQMIKYAKQLLQSHVRYAFIGDFTQTEIAEQVFCQNKYDLALCSFALHHIEDSVKREIIDLLANCINPKGLLLLADEIAVDRPAGWGFIEHIRARSIQGYLHSGKISQDFWKIESSISEADRLPFRPARIDDLISWMARGGFAVSCPLVMFGSALLVGVRA